MESNHREHLEHITEGMDTQIAALTEQVNALRSMLESKFVTRDEVQSTLLDNLTKQATERFDKMDSDGESRHAEFVKHYEARLENLATKDEVAGVITASAENAQRLTKLEATSETSITALEKRLDKVENKTVELAASIEGIRTDTDKIAQSSDKMSTAFVEFLGRDEKYKREAEREIDAIKIGVSHQVNDIIELQQQVNKQHRNINDQRTWIIETLNPMELVIMGNKESGTTGIAAEIKDVKTRQLALENGLSILTKFINNPIGRGFIMIFMAGNIISFFVQLTK